MLRGIKIGVLPAAMVAALIPVMAGCSRQVPRPDDRSMVLVAVGDTTLTVADVTARIPVGLSADDSLSLFSSIVETWLEDALLRELAEENAVDVGRIDRMVADYRKRLIVNEYMRQMERGHVKGPDETEVRAAFEACDSAILTEVPLVRGVYLKVAGDADRLEDIRRWMRSGSRSSLDNIEKHGLADAIEYDCFTDRWVDWSELSARIPHRFGDAATFMAKGRYFETTDHTAVYLLHISDVLPAGVPMPYDFAAPQIRLALQQQKRACYGRDLISSLAEKARKDGRLSTPGYDFNAHKMIISK